MSNQILNTVVLAALLVVVGGAGYYVTGKQLPAEIERLEQEEDLLRQREADLAGLVAEQAASAEQAEALMRQWNSRYKILPDRITSPEVVRYFNQLTTNGFRAFDIALNGATRGQNVSTLTYNITGKAYFGALYAFIGHGENGRGLYHVRDLEIEGVTEMIPVGGDSEMERMVQMVDFSLAVDVYFAGLDDMSAPDSLIEVPDGVFPPRSPAGNPFYPAVLANLPPNIDNLVDVETDSLMSVVGNSAVFLRGLETRTLQPGSRVYLGRITSVDPVEARVTAELNKGGIRERVEMDLQTGERYRQAFGNVTIDTGVRMAPSEVPPQPGTPEARVLEEALDSSDEGQMP